MPLTVANAYGRRPVRGARFPMVVPKRNGHASGDHACVTSRAIVPHPTRPLPIQFGFQTTLSQMPVTNVIRRSTGTVAVFVCMSHIVFVPQHHSHKYNCDMMIRPPHMHSHNRLAHRVHPRVHKTGTAPRTGAAGTRHARRATTNGVRMHWGRGRWRPAPITACAPRRLARFLRSTLRPPESATAGATFPHQPTLERGRVAVR